MKKLSLVAAVLGALVSIATIWILTNLPEQIQVQGILMPRDVQMVTMPFAGILEWVPQSSGATVLPGEVLFSIRTREISENITVSKIRIAALDTLSAGLRSLMGFESRQGELVLDSRRLRTESQRASSYLYSKSDLDSSLLEDRAYLLGIQRNAQELSLRLGENQWQRAAEIQNLRVLEDRLSRSQIRAPFKGVVEYLDPEGKTGPGRGVPGQFLPEGAGVCRLWSKEGLGVVVEIPTEHRSRITLGQNATLVAVSSVTRKLIISEITRIGSPESGGIVRVWIRWDQGNPEIFSKYTVTLGLGRKS